MPIPDAHPLLSLLEGRDRRSIGQAEDALARVLADPTLLAVLIQGMQSGSAVLRMRCADVAEKVTARLPECLRPHQDAILRLLRASTQREVRWHVAPMASRLCFTDTEVEPVMHALEGYLADESRIVQVMALQAMADLATRHPAHLPRILLHVRELNVMGAPAVRARCRKLLPTLLAAIQEPH